MTLRCYAMIQAMSILLVSGLFAQESASLLKNFSGCLELNTIFNTSTSNLNAIYEKNDEIDLNDLGKEADEFSYITLQLLFSVNYRFSNGLQAYVSTPFLNDSREGLSFGFFKEFTETSTLDMYLFLNGTFVWEDPYQYKRVEPAMDVEGNPVLEDNGSNKAITIKREQTIALLSGFAVQFEDIASSGICFDYKFSNLHIRNDEDIIGDNVHNLKRDGTIHAIGAGYIFYFNQYNFIKPTLWYLLGDIRGNSNRYDGHASEILYSRENKKYSVSLKALYGSNNFEEMHPSLLTIYPNDTNIGSTDYFSKKRDETIFSTELTFTWFELPRFKNWYARCGGGYINTDSKINFFSEQTSYLAFALGCFFG